MEALELLPEALDELLAELEPAELLPELACEPEPVLGVLRVTALEPSPLGVVAPVLPPVTPEPVLSVPLGVVLGVLVSAFELVPAAVVPVAVPVAPVVAPVAV